MRIVQSKPNYPLYVKCNTPKCPTCGVKVEYVESQLLDELDSLEYRLSGILDDRMKRLSTNTLGTEIKAAQDELDGLQATLYRVKELYLDGDIGKPEYQERKTGLDKEISDMALKKQALELKQARDDTQVNVQEIMSIITDLQEFPNKDMMSQNTMLKQIVDKIEYSRILPKDVYRRTANELYPPKIEIVYRSVVNVCRALFSSSELEYRIA